MKIKNDVFALLESEASDKAKKAGLTHVGGGNYAMDKGAPVIAKSVDGGNKLVQVKHNDDDAPKAKKSPVEKKKKPATDNQVKKPQTKQKAEVPSDKKISSSQNTLGADVNEIGLGQLLGGWDKFHDSEEVQKQMNQRREQIGEDEFNDQMGRAKSMADATLKWAAANGYKGKIKKVWWTARPGELGRAVGQEVDSRKNPTDTLVQFEDGQFLGLSAKSTKGKGDIGFKNPGLGTLQKQLDIDLSDRISSIEQDVVSKLNLPKAIGKRKEFIRDNPEIQKQTIEAGKKILNSLRDGLYDKLSSMDDKDLKDHILNDWMDAGTSTYPPYIKITGHGERDNFSTSIMDPEKDPKVDAIKKGKMAVVVTQLANDTIGVTLNGKRMMKMRFKYGSEKLASSVKMTGEPWTDVKKEESLQSDGMLLSKNTFFQKVIRDQAEIYLGAHK
jgi:hypothetical protein